MPPKTTTNKSKAIAASAAVESVKEVEISTTESVKEVEEITTESVKDDVVDNTSSLNDDNSSNNEEQNEERENKIEEKVSFEEILKLIQDRIENTIELIKALKSFSLYTKVQLKEIQKLEKILHKLESQYSEEKDKLLYFLAAGSAPKPPKNVDENGKKIPIPGIGPVVWYDFVKDAFELESNNGFSSKYLELMWPFIKSEEGVKVGSSIIISKPGKVNTFFQNIKRVMEERGINTVEDKKSYQLIENGVLKNTDITKFSIFCRDVKEIKPKASKKAKAE